ncbi:MAG: phosphoribosyl-ATP diphosphatase [Gemmatimonadaceae bacterium]
MPNATPSGSLTSALDFEKGAGTVVVVTQDATSGTVLMVAHADRHAVDCSLETREMHYTSRTRGLWRKGATSGNVQRLIGMSSDCDGDALLARVSPAGPACHLGAVSCFGEEALAADAFGRLARTVRERAIAPPPNGSYTASLLADRNLRLKKLGEEAAELIAACADGDLRGAVAEAADLVYHVAVALASLGTSLNAVRDELAARNRSAG